MRTFTPKQNQSQKPVIPSLAQAELWGLQPQREKPDAGLTAAPPPRFGHDFSRVALHPSAKLMINEPGDQHEQEADRVADKVMRAPEPKLQRACACGGLCPTCRTEQPGPDQEHLYTKRVESGGREGARAPQIVHEVLRSPGQPIDIATRTFMEPRFGHDFSNIRLHTDERAADSARAIDAAAYTAGHHLVFGAGRYSSATTWGRHLLAHELAHSIQQASAPNRLARKEDPPKKPKCDTGRALRWGQETTCSRFGAFEGVRESGEGKKWKSWGCYNHWPFSLEVYARNQLGIHGAASCKASHVKEIATVSLKDKEVEVLCSDSFPTDATHMIELSPNAMQELSGGLENLPSVKVCYSGSKQSGLSEWNGRLPRNPEVEDCITRGCPAPEDAPKLKDTGWPTV